ncbi:tetratricopeptide repeat protein [Flavobacterium sp. xlx-214]|uniref:tetratricopeptide repeat protein n=1 Tax=unclassified Flavobacterium TaxID=196869 RepID=UPI0013D5BEA6|nr:tetratricopeptide repeat protein [Flavobacterium sp. xlx-214]MBA5794095.1 tetratricopeptide repeat protein [Flavobacterium sp. xlx-221]QMI84004.1 tetratricopeptide repeat protein [Flavobacterium sp. xlx-214]
MHLVEKIGVCFKKHQRVALLSLVMLSCIQIFAASNKQEINAFINQNKEITKPATIRKNYEKTTKSSSAKNNKSLNVVNKVLQAHAYSQTLDAINDKSLTLYLEALNEANELEDTSLIIYVNTEVGYFYYSYNEYLKAMPYFIRTSQLLQNADDTKLIQASEVYKKNAYFFGSLNEHEKSIAYLKKALKFTPSYTPEYGAILNNIGSAYYKMDNKQEAEQYFLKTQAVSLENNDKVRYAKSLGDLALIYKDKKEYNKAISLLQEDIAISEAENAERNIMYAQILLSKIFVETKQFTQAKNTLQLALDYVTKKGYLKSHGYQIAQVNLEIALQTKDTALELSARRAIDSLGKDIADKDGQEAVNLANWETQKSEFNRTIEIEKAKLEKANLRNWIIGGFMLVLILVVTLVMISIKRKFKIELSQRENHILNYKVDQLLADKKLIDSEQTLNAYETYLKNQNQQIRLLEKELKNIQENTSQTNVAVQLIKDMIDQQRMSDNNWLALKKTFIKEENNYYDYLLANFPDLSENNLRMVILNKMGLQKAEIALVLNVKIDVVEEALQRLRIKYHGSFDDHTLN